MATILARSFENLLGALPDWREIGTDAMNSDVCVMAVGFEDRTPALIEKWSEGSAKVGAVLIKYRTNQAENDRNLKAIRRRLSENSIPFEELDYDRRTIGARVARALGKMVKGTGVLVDISSMASFVLYPVLRAIIDAMPDQRLTIGYAEAQTYYPEKAEWESFWQTLSGKDLVGRAEMFDSQYFQSTGSEQVYEAMSFVGRNPNDLPGKLVMIPNFSFHRVFTMREFAMNSLNVERSGVQWIVGKPPNNEVNGWRAEAVYNLSGNPKICEYCCTFNYKDVFAKLQSVWEENYTKRSLYIATLGSKAQHLGTLMFLLLHPEVSLLVSEPTSFVAARFSAGVGKMWQVNFGQIAALSERLTRWNRLDFVWD